MNFSSDVLVPNKLNEMDSLLEAMLGILPEMLALRIPESLEQSENEKDKV